MNKLLLTLCLFATPALAAFPGTPIGGPYGSDILPACKAMAAGDGDKMFDQGQCYATVSTLISVGEHMKDICAPKDATVGQGVEFVIKYLEANQPRLGEQFTKLAVEALTQAWPCSK